VNDGAVAQVAPPRRRLTGAQRRASILEAALTVFGKRGYEHVRSDDVAAAAGVSKALIYEHFRSKEDLYLELLDTVVGEAMERVIEVGSRPAASGVERFEPAIRATLEWMHDRPQAFRLLVRSVSDPAIAARQRELQRHATTALAQLMEQEPPETRQGLDRPQLEQLARMIVGSVHGLGQWLAENGEWDVDDAVEILMSFMWLGLAGLREGDRWTVRDAERRRRSGGETNHP
jgi:AcrR family transcriptional regulator